MNTQTKNDVSDNFNQVATDTQGLLDATAEATEETVIEARNRLKAAMAVMGETCDKVKAKAIAGAQATDKAVRDNPWQAVGIAFGLGALLGFLVSRRSRD